MTDNSQSVFEDLMTALHEVEEFQKGNIQLRSNVVTLPTKEETTSELRYQTAEA